MLGNQSELVEVRDTGVAGIAAIKAAADEFAASVLPLIWDLQDKGGTLRSIARELDARRIKTARGGTWTATQVQRILERSQAQS